MKTSRYQTISIIYDVGDKPGSAIYECLYCYWMVPLEENAPLPPCGYCEKRENTKYTRVDREKVALFWNGDELDKLLK